MDSQIKKISHFYAGRGTQMGDDIQRALSKCGIVILDKTPLYIEFTPWITGNSRIDDNLKGRIFWNPVNDAVKVHYSLHLPFSANSSAAFSRCLKWYLYKWNENRPEAFKKTGISFIYPGTDNTEILLQAKCKVSLQQIDKKIRSFLLQMNDIMESEGDTIISILSGAPPVEFKNEIFEEIFYILSEMN